LRRSNQKRGKQADEHGGNQRRMDEQPFVELTSRGRFANCDRRTDSFFNPITAPSRMARQRGDRQACGVKQKPRWSRLDCKNFLV
jgi:hypothetical protein